MKKFFSMMAVLAAMFAFVACTESTPDSPEPTKKETLAKPELTETHTATSFTVTWNPVSNADSYIVNYAGKNTTITECEFKVENLNAGDYTVKVKAKGDGYIDSDLASITISITGLVDCDWFSQELFIVEEPTELSDGSIAYPYDSVFFVWKGTDIMDVQYAFATTAEFEGVSVNQIKESMMGFGENLPTLLGYIHGENGYTGIFAPLNGGTSYTLYTLVTNNDGVEYLAKNEISTATVETTEEAMSWVGTWTVKSHKIYSIDNTGTGTVKDQEDEFTVTITPSTAAPDEVIVDGFSVLGAEWETVAQAEEDRLYILNGTNLGYDDEQGFYYYWVGFYSDPIKISLDAYPSNILTMAEGGAAATSTNVMTFYDEQNNPVEITCYCSDVMGVDNSGNIYFFIEAFPAVYRSGDMEWTKTSAAAAAQNAGVRSVNSVIKSSLVVK